MYFLKYLFYFNFKINLLYRRRIFFEILFLSFYNNSIFPYCAKFYGRGFIRGYEDESSVIKLCTVWKYSIIPVVSTVVSPVVSTVVAPIVSPVLSTVVIPVVSTVVSPVVSTVVSPVVSTVVSPAVSPAVSPVGNRI